MVLPLDRVIVILHNDRNIKILLCLNLSNCLILPKFQALTGVSKVRGKKAS